MLKRLLFGLLAMSGMSTTEALAQTVVFLQCTLFNGRVERIKLDANVKTAELLNGGSFALEVSESFYTLTGKVDLGAGCGGVVEVETNIDRRSERLTSRIIGMDRQLLGGICSRDRPW